MASPGMFTGMTTIHQNGDNANHMFPDRMCCYVVDVISYAFNSRLECIAFHKTI